MIEIILAVSVFVAFPVGIAIGLYKYRKHTEFEETQRLAEEQKLREDRIRYQAYVSSRPPEKTGITPTAVQPMVKLKSPKKK